MTTKQQIETSVCVRYADSAVSILLMGLGSSCRIASLFVIPGSSYYLHHLIT